MPPPRAGCGKSARPVVRPAKAGTFSRGQTCRGKSQNPVAWIAERRETEFLKPIDDRLLGRRASHRAVMKVNVNVASKVRRSEGRACNREGEGSMSRRNLADAPIHFGGVEATVR